METGTAALGASITVSPPVWEWTTLPATLFIVPPPHVDLPATLTISEKKDAALHAALHIRQTRPGVWLTELNWNKGPYGSFEALLSAAMGGGTQAQVVAEQFVAPGAGSPDNGVP